MSFIEKAWWVTVALVVWGASLGAVFFVTYRSWQKRFDRLWQRYGEAVLELDNVDCKLAQWPATHNLHTRRAKIDAIWTVSRKHRRALHALEYWKLHCVTEGGQTVGTCLSTFNMMVDEVLLTEGVLEKTLKERHQEFSREQSRHAQEVLGDPRGGVNQPPVEK